MIKMTAVYAGSFDPVTSGHLDIIQRAAQIFGHLFVVVGIGADKKYLFSADERVAMLRDLLSTRKNIEVHAHGGLTVEFAKKNKANVLIRGLRSGADYTYEMAMAQMNRKLAPDIETVFIPTNSEYFHVSSTLVKDIAKHGGDLSSMVPPLVVKKISEKSIR